jgi:hypothetical protein
MRDACAVILMLLDIMIGYNTFIKIKLKFMVLLLIDIFVSLIYIMGEITTGTGPNSEHTNAETSLILDGWYMADRKVWDEEKGLVSWILG